MRELSHGPIYRTDTEKAKDRMRASTVVEQHGQPLHLVYTPSQDNSSIGVPQTLFSSPLMAGMSQTFVEFLGSSGKNCVHSALTHRYLACKLSVKKSS